MEPLLNHYDMFYGAAGVLLTVLFGACRVRQAARRHRLAEDRFWYDLADRAERERTGLFS